MKIANAKVHKTHNRWLPGLLNIQVFHYKRPTTYKKIPIAGKNIYYWESEGFVDYYIEGVNKDYSPKTILGEDGKPVQTDFELFKSNAITINTVLSTHVVDNPVYCGTYQCARAILLPAFVEACQIAKVQPMAFGLNPQGEEVMVNINDVDIFNSLFVYTFV